jgi:hypothetical protein
MATLAKERFRNFIVQAWSQRFGLTKKQIAMMTDGDYWQLSQCRSDEARRLILGVGFKDDPAERLRAQ